MENILDSLPEYDCYQILMVVETREFKSHSVGRALDNSKKIQPVELIIKIEPCWFDKVLTRIIFHPQYLTH